MWLRIHTWYLSKTPLTQLLILLLVNGVFWFVAWEFYLWVFNEPGEPLHNRVLFSLWMSLVLTLPMNVKKLRQILKKKA